MCMMKTIHVHKDNINLKWTAYLYVYNTRGFERCVTIKIVIHTYLSSATVKLNTEMKSHKYMKASGALWMNVC